MCSVESKLIQHHISFFFFLKFAYGLSSISLHVRPKWESECINICVIFEFYQDGQTALLFIYTESTATHFPLPHGSQHYKFSSFFIYLIRRPLGNSFFVILFKDTLDIFFVVVHRRWGALCRTLSPSPVHSSLNYRGRARL